MFKTRLLSGIVLVLLAVILIVLGNDVLLLALAGISLIGMYELFRIFKMEKSILSFSCYLLILLYFLQLRFHILKDSMAFVILSLVVCMAVYVFTYPKYRTEQVLAAFFGIFYVGVMLSAVYQTRMLTNGAYIVWLIFLGSWGSDTCAYCVGVLFGKHKMSPKLSPKKSVEGAVGGVVGSMLLTALYVWIFRTQMGLVARDILMLSVIGGVSALISMVGDLAASAIKRNYEIKDYGNLIPGHGGILDRFDSVIFTAPVIFYLSQFLF